MRVDEEAAVCENEFVWDELNQDTDGNAEDPTDVE